MTRSDIADLSMDGQSRRLQTCLSFCWLHFEILTLDPQYTVVTFDRIGRPRIGEIVKPVKQIPLDSQIST
jgi:hypothetical protein